MLNMSPLAVALLFLISVKAAPHPDNSIIARHTPDSFSNDINLTEDPKKLAKKFNNTKDYKNEENVTSKSQEIQTQNVSKAKKSRWHKAFFLNHPFVPQVHKYPPSSYNENNKNFIEERRPGHRKHQQDSKIFYVRLPPAPYFFVPGLGYISNPPKFSTSSLKPHQPHSHQNSIIRLPLDFVSNGKPTSIYQWNKTHKPTKKPITPINKLKKGPYVFNGKPTSLYLLRPNGETSIHQPIRYTDIEANNIY